MNKLKIECSYREIGRQFLRSDWVMDICEQQANNIAPEKKKTKWRGKSRVNVSIKND